MPNLIKIKPKIKGEEVVILDHKVLVLISWDISSTCLKFFEEFLFFFFWKKGYCEWLNWWLYQPNSINILMGKLKEIIYREGWEE